MSVQRYGLFHVPRFATLVIVTQRLATIDNEIWLEKIHFDFSTEGHFLKSWSTLKIISQVVVNQSGRILSWVLPTCRNGNIDLIFRRLPDPILIHSCLSRIHAVGNHEWTRINTNGPAVERLWVKDFDRTDTALAVSMQWGPNIRSR